MKKYNLSILSALLILCMAFVSCGKKNKEKSETPDRDLEVEEVVEDYDEMKDEDSIPELGVSMNQESSEAKKGTVIDFYATWCGPCKQIAPVFDELMNVYDKDFNFRRIDIDEKSAVADQFNVEAVPTFVFLDAKGNEVHRIVGADADGLRSTLSNWKTND